MLYISTKLNMKKISLVIIVLLGFQFYSCEFIDVVPEEAPTLEHAFSNRAVAYKFLNTCYSHLPDPTDPFYYPAHFTSRDELELRDPRAVNNSIAGKIAQGLQSASNPLQDYWSGRNGGKALYVGIRDCNIFLENIHKPQDIQEVERQRWIAEVKFLKAFYHFFLMKLYGPVAIVDENLPISATPEETQVYREPIDVCVDYIVNLLDEASVDLPPVLTDPDMEMGRITRPIALGVKAKVLVWAASPLFNGNPDYAAWVDNRGLQLIPSEYDPSKWQRAADAIKEAIDVSLEYGHRLYEFNKFSGGPSAFKMNDTVVQLMTIRKAITEDINRNPGVIWATQEQFANSKGGAGGSGLSLASLGNMLRSLWPALYAEDVNFQANYYRASWHMGELYYSNNGVPIQEDKFYDYANRHEPRLALPADDHHSYIATGEVTAGINFYREPRFYAGLCFDRGFIELSTTTDDSGESFEFWRARYGEVSNAVGLGTYNPKKLMAFESSGSQGDNNKTYSPYNYQFPLLRLSDLFLLYSEALNEIKSEPDEEVYRWIDMVREQAGLDGVVESWQKASTKPDAPRNKAEMRKIIQRERMIELAFEGQRFWDVRRWKIADQYWTLPPTSWSPEKDYEDYYEVFHYGEPRSFTFRDYLYPIRESDLRVNPNLVQTYGW